MRVLVACLIALIAAGALVHGQAGQPSNDEDRPGFEEWLAEFRQEALESGLSPAVVEQALDGLEPLVVVVERDRSQAETVLTLEQYLERRLTRRLVRTAQEMAARYRTLLAGVSRRYDVQSRDRKSTRLNSSH